MKTLRDFVEQAQSWLGLNEDDGSFMEIIDAYNSYKPVARNALATKDSEWCDIFVSACAIKTGAVDIIGTESYVPYHIQKFKNLGIWHAADGFKPQAGDIVVFDWDGVKDGDHIGIVKSVYGSTVTTIEGNVSRKVYSRTYSVGWSRVTGYARPNFATKTQVARLYNKSTGEHFYTVSLLEKLNLVKHGWKDEGTLCTVPIKSDYPVYRLYNKNAGDHFFTTNPNEANNLVKAGWKNEGVAFYSAGVTPGKEYDINSGDGKTIPIYRLYNPNAKTGTHHFTRSMLERDYLNSVGWVYEGIGWTALNE